MQVRKLNKVCLEKKLDTFLCPPPLVFQINYRSLCIGLVNKSKNKTNRTAIKAAKKKKEICCASSDFDFSPRDKTLSSASDSRYYYLYVLLTRLAVCIKIPIMLKL